MIDENLRAAVTSLWRLDAEMTSIMRNVQEPHLQMMRLVWWRDRLEALEAGEGAPAHPVLQALAGAYKDRDDIQGLHQLADTWADFAEVPVLDAASACDFASRRGLWLFTRSAALLGDDGRQKTEKNGVKWGLSDVASHISDPMLAKSLFDRSLEGQEASFKEKALKPLAAASKLAEMRANLAGRRRPLREQSALLRISLFGA